MTLSSRLFVGCMTAYVIALALGMCRVPDLRPGIGNAMTGTESRAQVAESGPRKAVRQSPTRRTLSASMPKSVTRDGFAAQEDRSGVLKIWAPAANPQCSSIRDSSQPCPLYENREGPFVGRHGEQNLTSERCAMNGPLGRPQDRGSCRRSRLPICCDQVLVVCTCRPST